LIPGGAHIAELPNTLALGRKQYFMVQQIYRGWALSGVVNIAAFVANLALATMMWQRGAPYWLPAIACLAIAALLAVSFVWVYPTNAATANSTRDLGQLGEATNPMGIRHLAGAGLILIALCSVAFTCGS
jgi:hypothetical protein